jgi:phytoene dehydrogenase-like protein
MTIPSSIDRTLTPSNSGKHIVQLFVQYAPYDVSPRYGRWSDPQFKHAFADRCFQLVDQYAPGFSRSVIARDVLSPWDLEQIFGLPGGNISHGALSLDQIGYCRPVPGYTTHRSPIEGLYMCSGKYGNFPMKTFVLLHANYVLFLSRIHWCLLWNCPLTHSISPSRSLTD